MNSIMSRTLSIHNEHGFLLALEKAGLNDARPQKVFGSKDNDMALKIVRLIFNGGFEPTTSQKCAREIMGKNFFGIEEAIGILELTPRGNRPLLSPDVPLAS